MIDYTVGSYVVRVEPVEDILCRIKKGGIYLVTVLDHPSWIELDGIYGAWDGNKFKNAKAEIINQILKEI